MTSEQQAKAGAAADQGVLISSAPSGWWRDLIEAAVEVWRTRELAYALALRDIRIRYKEAALGFVWAIVMPCLVVLSGLVMRLAMAGGALTGNLRALVLPLVVKGLAWSFFAGAINAGTVSLTSSAHLVSRIYFPRAILPAAAVMTQLFDSAIAAAVMCLIVPWLGAQWSTALVWVPVLAFLLIVFTTAAALFLSCANVFFRDVKYFVQVLLSFGIFFTPVFFEPSMLGETGARLVMLNPLAPLLEGLRLSVATGHDLLQPLLADHGGVLIQVWNPFWLAYSAAWALVGFILAALLFRRAESMFAEFV